MSNDTITIEVNGAEVEATPGQMLIEVTDRVGCYVPRFCYHDKLSVAANCRMCLVEVENAPKPLPACATPVAPGMKVFTRSAAAIGAQRATMEFLLINHPLDCPICDQGGECELQDLAMGFGRDVSRFAERKRVVRDKNLGPLVSTDMTRCIHCTRCVRFGEEIAGMPELGTIGRGDRMQISTFVEQSLQHELSGNIIDLCPVGALNSKPYRFSARAWELEQHDTVAPHDCAGSNLHAHVLRGRLKRVVPRANEQVNETWISDRDRFSYEGIYSDDRLDTPMVRVDGQLKSAEWAAALDAAVAGLKDVIGEYEAESVGAWISPSATVEEHYLAARIMDHVGSGNIDHRLRRRDFRNQAGDAVVPGLGMALPRIDSAGAIFVVGADLRHEAPIIAHRVRKAALAGGSVDFLDETDRPYLFAHAPARLAPAASWCTELALILKAAGGGNLVAGALADFVRGAGEPSAEQHAIADHLSGATNGLILTGLMALGHPDHAAIDGLCQALAKATGSHAAQLTFGANSAGAALAGSLPHRDAAGRDKRVSGADIARMLREPPKGLLLFGTEPEVDMADGGAADLVLGAAGFVVACTPYLAGSIAAHADVVLPIGTFAETSGTFVNVAGDWQSFKGVAAPVGQARPGWKVLRVLGNLFGLPDSEYLSSEEVRDELRRQVEASAAPDTTAVMSEHAPVATMAFAAADLEVPIYGADAVVRRASSLQHTAAAGHRRGNGAKRATG